MLKVNDVLGVLLGVDVVIKVLLDRLFGLELVVLIELVIRIVAHGLNVCSPVVQSHSSAAM